MVLKKTNCVNVNSGNTMKKRYYTQECERYQAQTTHVIKCLKNILLVNPGDGKTWEVDAAKAYFDDGGLANSSGQFGFFWRTPFVYYSMNKKRRWLLEDVIAEAVHDEELAEEPFKVTLVRRAVPILPNCKLSKNRHCNVTHYYDSHMPARMVTSNNAYSIRQSLLQKGSDKQEEEVDKKSKHQLKRRQGHNQHFRGVQRKVLKRSSVEKETRAAAVVEHDNIPEIRYEIAEAEQLRYSSLKYRGKGYDNPNSYVHFLNHTCFRGIHRERLSWYYTDSTYTARKGCPCTVSDLDDVDYFGEDEDVEPGWDELQSPPAQPEFSLLDLAVATQNKQRLKATRNSHKATEDAETVPVNSASNQRVKKYGKGSVIFVQAEEEVIKEADYDFDIMQKMAAETDTDGDSGLHSGDETNVSLELSLDAVIDCEEELAKFDDSFCSCGILQSEFNVHYLQETFGSAVEFGKCSPFTVRFDMHAVSAVLNSGVMEEKETEELAEWWLICQTGARLPCQLDTARHIGEDVVMVNMKLHGSHEESDVEAVNLELQQLVKDAELMESFSMYTLLVFTCGLLGRLSAYNGSTRSKSKSDSASRPLDIYLPHELYVGQVTVCSVKQAYHHLQSKQQLSSQRAEEGDLETFCSLTWIDECSICLSGFEDASSEGRFSSFVAMTACGHCFCRQCWQRHLVSSICEGQTTLNCMEYKCDMTVDTTTLLSLVPQWVFTRWQQRLHSKAVECSGEWRWCPNARCGLLAKCQGSKRVQNFGKGAGVPVVCQCQKRWCLDCGREAHWPVTCTQFNTYTKMLRQNGDEDGLKTTAMEITYVRVKRCPGCNYPLEKNGGCCHMTCSQCWKSFCWVCLKDWSEHVNGGWTGCNERQEEGAAMWTLKKGLSLFTNSHFHQCCDQTVELDNDKLYPLPIHFYKKAVSFRYTWKNLDRVRHSSVIAYRNLYAFMRRNKGYGGFDAIAEDAVNRVIDAFVFLKKAHTLLELSYILLSNTPRHHHLTRPLLAELELLEFMSERVALHLEQPKKRVLMTTDALQRITNWGQCQIHRACRHSHHLMSKVQGTATQEWLLQADHERFVSYK